MELELKEKLMFNVMKIIYDSGIPISFKGSMVMRACLREYGFNDEIRFTQDIDANWYSSEMPSTFQIRDSLQKAFDIAGSNFKVEVFREYGEKRSAGFEIYDSNNNELIFTMDIDVNRPIASEKYYEIDDIHFTGVSPTQMLADKLCVVSSDKIFRRIKDLIDLYYFSKTITYNPEDIYLALKKTGRQLEDFNAFINRKDELQHSFEKFRLFGISNKYSFNDVYMEVEKYIQPFLNNK